MYDTIDSITEGTLEWKHATFRYNGLLPRNPPQWMLEEYTLAYQNSEEVLHEQMGTPDFDGEIDYVPFMEFNEDAKRVDSNLMSGNWANNKAVSQGPLFFTALSATDCFFRTKYLRTHQQRGVRWSSLVKALTRRLPLLAPGTSSSTLYTNSSEISQMQHVVVTVMVLSLLHCSPFQKVCMPFIYIVLIFSYIVVASKEEREKMSFQRFCRQLYHTCVGFVFEPLKKGMTEPVVMRCPDGHYRRCIYQLGPYIADYPEQVWLAAIVQNWCPK